MSMDVFFLRGESDEKPMVKSLVWISIYLGCSIDVLVERVANTSVNVTNGVVVDGVGAGFEGFLVENLEGVGKKVAGNRLIRVICDRRWFNEE